MKTHVSTLQSCSTDDSRAVSEQYGFVLDSNPHDAALLPVGALPDGLVRAGLQQKECWLHPCGVPSWDLLRALRIWAASHFGQG